MVEGGLSQWWKHNAIPYVSSPSSRVGSVWCCSPVWIKCLSESAWLKWKFRRQWGLCWFPRWEKNVWKRTLKQQTPRKNTICRQRHSARQRAVRTCLFLQGAFVLPQHSWSIATCAHCWIKYWNSAFCYCRHLQTVCTRQLFKHKAVEDLSSLMSSCSHLQITLNACNAEGWQLSECVGMYFYSWI